MTNLFPIKREVKQKPKHVNAGENVPYNPSNITFTVHEDGNVEARKEKQEKR